MRLRSSIKLLTLRAGTMSLIAGLALQSLMPVAQAQSDITPPTLVSATMVSGAQLVSDQANQNTFFDVSVTDELSGIYGAPLIYYSSPSGKQSFAASTIGQTYDGTNWNYDFDVNFPQYVETGIWTPTIAVRDVSGNTRTYSNSQLLAVGRDLRVTFTGVGDTTPETLASMSLTAPRSQDVSTPLGAGFTFEGLVTDNLAGIANPTLTFASPSGQQIKTTNFSLESDPLGHFTAFTSFPQYSETGIWLPTLTLTDAVGNTATLTNADLLARGIDLHLVITGTSDVTPPSLSDINIGLANPVVNDVPNGGAVITLYATMSDNITGVSGATTIGYTSPSGNQHADSTVTSITNGVYQYTTYLPAYSESGVWQPTITLVDSIGNTSILNGAALTAMGYPIALNVTKNVTKSAVAGETVTSDVEGDGATLQDPVEVTVTTPNAGDVSIVIVASDAVTDPTNGYTFFDRQLSIVAPGAAANNPLTLAFRIDASKVPVGESAATLQITRNGEIVAGCIDQTNANPDACVFSRTTLADGDILVRVHSTHASAWASGFASHSYSFRGFKNPTKDMPKINKADAGSVVGVEFKVQGAVDTNFMADGYPTTQRVNCSTLATMGATAPALTKKDGVKKTGNHFTYFWKTQNSWDGTCRLFTVKVKGESSAHSALFDLR